MPTLQASTVKENQLKDLFRNPFVLSGAASFIASGIFYAITRNWWYAIIALVLLGTLASVLAWVWRYYKACRLLGVESSSLRASEDWTSHYLNSKNVRVFFTRGGSVLGTDTDPMYQVVKGLPPDWNGQIRVLILNPNSKYIGDRASELELEEDEVREQIRNVIKNCKRLREKWRVNIHPRFYDSKPFLRFVLFDDLGFFSYPAWGEKYKPYPYHFRIERRGRQQSLYNALSVYFEQLWNLFPERKEGDENTNGE